MSRPTVATPDGLIRSYLCDHLAMRDAQGLGHPFTVSRIGLRAVADVPDLDFLGCIAHGTGRVLEERLLLIGAHHLEQGPGLGVVFIVVFAVVPVVGSTFQTQRRFPEITLLLPLADNGGPTLSRALLSGSPAIDAIPVVSCTLPTDQRGGLRPIVQTSSDTPCDIGAFEVQTE